MGKKNWRKTASSLSEKYITQTRRPFRVSGARLFAALSGIQSSPSPLRSGQLTTSITPVHTILFFSASCLCNISRLWTPPYTLFSPFKQFGGIPLHSRELEQRVCPHPLFEGLFFSFLFFFWLSFLRINIDHTYA